MGARVVTSVLVSCVVLLIACGGDSSGDEGDAAAGAAGSSAAGKAGSSAAGASGSSAAGASGSSAAGASGSSAAGSSAAGASGSSSAGASGSSAGGTGGAGGTSGDGPWFCTQVGEACGCIINKNPGAVFTDNCTSKPDCCFTYTDTNVNCQCQPTTSLTCAQWLSATKGTMVSTCPP